MPPNMAQKLAGRIGGRRGLTTAQMNILAHEICCEGIEVRHLTNERDRAIYRSAFLDGVELGLAMQERK